MDIKHYKKFFFAFILAASSLAFVGCSDDSDLEDAMEDTKDAAEDAADEMGDAAEKAADNIKDATN